jgi:hypothetical protein
MVRGFFVPKSKEAFCRRFAEVVVKPDNDFSTISIRECNKGFLQLRRLYGGALKVEKM